MYVVRETLDDLLGVVYRRLLRSRNRLSPTKGPNREETGVLLKLANPRNRFSRTEERATLLSCLGETLWYLSGSDTLDFVEYYIPKYREFSKIPQEATSTTGAYGPRLFAGKPNQIKRIIDMLNDPDKRSTRQAVVQIFDQADLGEKDVPCTCTVQFFARGDYLHCQVSMRSNDAYRGLPHDVFAFTVLQELVARSTDLEIGTYSHSVGSLHLYDREEARAKKYIAAGWQDTIGMPPMPKGDPWTSVRWLLDMERQIREGATVLGRTDGIDPYWIDLARLLLVKRLFDQKDHRGVVKQKNLMSSTVYDAFIRGREAELPQAFIPQPDIPGLVVGKEKQS
ncbi:thymidylate synthase [Mesorhizobium sp. L103C131B0]|uniref:thymidylate synthase n=1 Tax=Mesorhizobium sp. L103C131B0 TaxID=1287089 RepID=UPI0003CFF412|nr:thymidylate synthase [Mesorhizobium sp. L103C131B0]ESZ62706.1 thymidylate synthase [Mesorhizobium sp. L103C131B0]